MEVFHFEGLIPMYRLLMLDDLVDAPRYLKGANCTPEKSALLVVFLVLVFVGLLAIVIVKALNLLVGVDVAEIQEELPLVDKVLLVNMLHFLLDTNYIHL